MFAVTLVLIASSSVAALSGQESRIRLRLAPWESIQGKRPLRIVRRNDGPPNKDRVGPIYGQVTNNQGQPLSNVRVLIEPIKNGWIKRREVITTRDGEYRFDDIPEGDYRLRVSAVPGSSLQFREVQRQVKFRGSVIIGGSAGIKYRNPHASVSFQISSATPKPSPSPTPRPSATATPTLTPYPSPSALPTPEATASPRIGPSPTERPSPSPGASPGSSPNPSPQSKLDERLQQMDWGNIAFNVPPSMTLDKAELIVLNLSLNRTIDDLKKTLHEKGVEGNIEGARIQVDENMQAVLTGDGFHITPVTVDTLPISKQSVTEWKWDVRPTRSGVLRLHLVLNALVEVDGTGKRPYPVRTFDKEYRVEVAWQDRPLFAFLGNNWQWLWTTLIIPIGAWLWNRRRKKRKAGFI